ncbi:MAG: metal-dependent transcriptional regulator [Acidobacteriota bacterium]
MIWLVGVAAACLVFVFWPRLGLLDRWQRASDLARRSRREDALKHILKCEANQRRATLESVAGAVEIASGAAAHLLEDLQAGGLVTVEAGGLRLRPAGRDIALHIIRAHRLWESFLAEETGVAEREWHLRAEKQEHLLTPERADELAARLGHPTHDPHGDAIPALDGTLEGERDRSLNDVDPGTPVVIRHIEDEPAPIYDQLLAQGLRAGMKAFVVEKDQTRIRFWADGDLHVLAPVLADSVAVADLPGYRREDLVAHQFLAGLKPGERGRVVEISPACRGPERRRLMDLGFVPGTIVDVDLVSPAGDPTAYRLRGSVVALRREQARLVRVDRVEAVAEVGS